MSVIDLLKRGTKAANDNSPVLLTALGVSGTIATAYLAGKASWRAARQTAEGPVMQSKREIAKDTWRFYIPAVLTGTGTVVAIIGANRVSSKRAAAAYSVLAVSQQAFSEYKDKVVEVLGEKKEQSIRDQVAQDRVTANPPPNVIITSGKSIFCELYTGRYFECDIPSLDRAVNEINRQVNNHIYATLDDLYDLLGLPHTQYSAEIGWDSDRLLELKMTTAVTPKQEPCFAFEYNYVKTIH